MTTKNKTHVNSIVVSRITQKRLVGELKLLQKEPLELIDAYPDENDTLVWYFLLRGPDFTDYKGGFYIGKVLHNPEYPIKPPDFMMLTPNGRFDIEKKICLTNSGYHSESWSAVWNMKTILLGFLSIMADDTSSGLSHIVRSPAERRMLAEKSVDYNILHLGHIWTKFERFVRSDGTVRSSEEIRALSGQAPQTAPVPATSDDGETTQDTARTAALPTVPFDGEPFGGDIAQEQCPVPATSDDGEPTQDTARTAALPTVPFDGEPFGGDIAQEHQEHQDPPVVEAPRRAAKKVGRPKRVDAAALENEFPEATIIVAPKRATKKTATATNDVSEAVLKHAPAIRRKKDAPLDIKN